MIAEFFEDKELFVTGGSGVVGKALIDKLLRSCNCRKIYLLLRPKKHLSLEERLQKLKKSMIFRRLHREKPNEFDEKICVIPGDLAQPMLAIKPEHIKLMENVSVIFHSAATVRFDEPLRKALQLNVAGTLETLKFAQTLKNLEVFFYVSTFFSHPYLEYIEPKVYDAPMDWKFCLDLIKRTDLPDEMIEIITRKLIVGFPNTYCFTKNLAESMVNDYRNKLPVAIFRPTIVIFAMEDPEPGFAPTFVGAMGLFTLGGTGLVKSLYMAKNHRLDMYCQDGVVRAMLYDAVKTAGIYAEGTPAETPVFLVSSSTHCAITMQQYIQICEKYNLWRKFAFEKSFLVPAIICTDNYALYQIVVFVKQIIPSLLVDGILKMSGRPPALMKIQRKLYTTLEIMRPFMFNKYDSPGITYAPEMLQELHGTEFQTDVLKFMQNYYLNISCTHDMIKSIREVLLKENPATIPRSRLIYDLKVIFYRMAQMFMAYKLYTKAMPIVTEWLKRSWFVTEWLEQSESGNSTMIGNL